jgi:iron complex outermembrane receptor protein
MSRILRLSACSAAIATIFAYSHPSEAQQAGARGALEEIVVTARRREESLQQVPVAITAFTMADIEARNIENTEDLNVLLPNVDIRGGGVSNGTSSFAVRGIPGIARYMDGVVMGSDIAGLESIVELERIEVLRGPQGTYFGKNAIGGAIQYITQKPGDEFGARIRLTMGEFNRTDIVANVDIPLGDRIKTKVTAAQLTRDGYVESVIVDEAYGAQDDQVVRASLEWEPSDSFTALFTAQSSRTDTNMQAAVLFDAVDNAGFGRNLPGTYTQAGFPFTDDLYAYGLRKEWKTAANYQGPGSMIDIDALTADLTWSINDSLTFRSISNTRGLIRGSMADSDATFYHAFDWWYYDEQDETTQEFQLLGSSGRLNWVVGLYYNEQDLNQTTRFWQGVELQGFCGGNPVNLPPSVCPNLSNTNQRAIREDNAIFAEVTFDFTEQLSLTVGGRSSKEKFRGENYVPLEPQGAPQTSNTNIDNRVIRTVAGVPVIQEATFQAFTPRIALQYQFNDDIMGYASVSQGFDAGGVNNRFEPALPNNGIQPYDEEILTNYELGVRSDLLDGRLRLNATYFNGTWEDIQVAEVLVISTTTTTNAGQAKIEGVEVEGAWAASDNFTLNFALGTLDTRYTDVGQATTISVNSRFPFAPDSSYSIGAQWDNDFSGGGSLMTRLDYGWINDFETFRDDRFVSAGGANDAYGLLSARLVYTPAVGNWDVAVFGTNLTNEFYRLGGFNAILAGVDQGYVARPRELGVSLSLRLQ